MRTNGYRSGKTIIAILSAIGVVTRGQPVCFITTQNPEMFEGVFRDECPTGTRIETVTKDGCSHITLTPAA